MSLVTSQQNTQSTTTALVCNVVNVTYEPELRYGPLTWPLRGPYAGTEPRHTGDYKLRDATAHPATG
jgi:hypothetical protein